MKLALIGAGQRGMIYANYAYEKASAQIVAVVDPNEDRRKAAAERFGITEENCFSDSDAFFQKGKLADALILASMDQDHYEQSLKALECGYHLLLEKPISPNPAECVEIQQKAHECDRKVVVCHVLRYTKFFAQIKKILASGELGKVLTVQHAENIGNFHMAHSFVRGNWRNSEQSSPIIMQKSCHDMDILVWLIGSRAKRISSFGNLTYFKEENAPEGSADRCLECSLREECRFDARKAYLEVAGAWPATVVSTGQTEEELLKNLETGPYGRCVFKCDNNVCDHQVSIIEFENGVTATFHLSGFTNHMHRTIKVMCEHGEIVGDDHTNVIQVTRYSSNSLCTEKTTEINVINEEGFHGGGDYRLVMDFISGLKQEDVECVSSIDMSIESHLMAYAAEKSRVEGHTIDVTQLQESLLKKAD